MTSRQSASANQKGRFERRIELSELEQLSQEWLLEGQLRQHSAQTLYCRRDYLRKIFWFFRHQGYTAVGAPEIKQFLLYLAQDNYADGGRWGNPRLTSSMRPVSAHAYYRVLNAMFRWLVEDEALDFNPMQRIKPPVVRAEFKQPPPDQTIQALLLAASRSTHSLRDQALIWVLLDTGLRASEICQLRMQDLDMTNSTIRVLGKGNKFRTCYLGQHATKALLKYLRKQTRQPHDPVFVSGKNPSFPLPLTPSGLYRILKRLANAAGLERCGPHSLRRAFAVNLLRNGSSVFAVQNLLGHTDLDQSRYYCTIAQADIKNQHRQFSPGDQLARGRSAKR